MGIKNIIKRLASAAGFDVRRVPTKVLDFRTYQIVGSHLAHNYHELDDFRRAMYRALIRSTWNERRRFFFEGDSNLYRPDVAGRARGAPRCRVTSEAGAVFRDRNMDRGWQHVFYCFGAQGSWRRAALHHGGQPTTA